jgi:hypothetical protein
LIVGDAIPCDPLARLVSNSSIVGKRSKPTLSAISAIGVMAIHVNLEVDRGSCVVSSRNERPPLLRWCDCNQDDIVGIRAATLSPENLAPASWTQFSTIRASYELLLIYRVYALLGGAKIGRKIR